MNDIERQTLIQNAPGEVREAHAGVIVTIGKDGRGRVLAAGNLLEMCYMRETLDVYIKQLMGLGRSEISNLHENN